MEDQAMSDPDQVIVSRPRLVSDPVSSQERDPGTTAVPPSSESVDGLWIPVGELQKSRNPQMMTLVLWILALLPIPLGLAAWFRGIFQDGSLSILVFVAIAVGLEAVAASFYPYVMRLRRTVPEEVRLRKKSVQLRLMANGALRRIPFDEILEIEAPTSPEPAGSEDLPPIRIVWSDEGHPRAFRVPARWGAVARTRWSERTSEGTRVRPTQPFSSKDL